MVLFDKAAFDSLIDRDKELFAELLQLYATEYPKILIDLAAAIQKSDLHAVEILAHRLRGMVRNFFAPVLADRAEEIEDGGRDGDLKDVPAKLEMLAGELRQLEAELTHHLGTYP